VTLVRAHSRPEAIGQAISLDIHRTAAALEYWNTKGFQPVKMNNPLELQLELLGNFTITL